MPTTINVHDHLTWAAQLIPDDRGSYVILRGTGIRPGVGRDTIISVIGPTRDELDGLIRAALDAKDLIPGVYVEQPPPDAGDSDPGGAS